MADKTIETPDLGGADDVTVIDVLVKPGDKIEKEASIVTLESDKATMDIPSETAGVVKAVKVKVGDKVSKGTPLLVLESESEEKEPSKKEMPKATKEAEETKVDAKPTKKSEEVPGARVTQEEKSSEADDKTKVLTGTLHSTSDIHAGPGVRRLARELGVDLAELEGTGPKERILKEDVHQFVKAKLKTNQLAPAAFNVPQVDFSKFGETELMSLSRIKKISGKNLQRNWMMIPHVTQFGEADITTLEDFRVSQKKSMEKQGVKLTPLVFVMKAVVASLKAFPHFNASLDPSGENLVLKNYYHIGVAVDTPDGLVVPVIRDVDKKGLVELAKELAQKSEKARKKQLTPNDMQGGSFSISSLGGIGGTAFTPIINAPEVAILGVSKSSYKPVYQDDTFVPRLMLPLSLSYDHRVIDGADGARFIVYLINMLSDIRNLLL